jgi:hypothetical protein
MSVSFDFELGGAIRAAGQRRQPKRLGLARKAARNRLRLEALEQAVGSWGRTFGPRSEAEIEAAERLMKNDKRKRSGAA